MTVMNFFQIVYNIVRQIPAGKVATYGQVALLAGSPRAARQVGYALRALGLNEENIPWWRVVNREGYLSINHGNGGVEKEIQKNLLEAEGVVVSPELQIDVAQYLWEADSN
jgi:methylated-DNA-protein-cysteine methyltransferase-like protein